MRISLLICFVCFSFILTKAQQNNGGVSFTANKGQVADIRNQRHPEILFHADGKGTQVYLRKTGVSYVVSNEGELIAGAKEKAEGEKPGRSPVELDKRIDEIIQNEPWQEHRIDVDFINCNPDPVAIATAEIPGYTNYYLAHCPEGVTRVKTYNQVLVKNVYNHIDFKYYGSVTSGLEYDIVINPGGNPSELKLEYKGANSMRIVNGKLEIRTSLSPLEEKIPKAFQVIGGRTTNVKVEYLLEGTVVSFKIKKWNPNYPLIIDPFIWATYFGGKNYTGASSIAVDKAGNACFTGTTFATDLPVTPGAFQTLFKGSKKAYVAKFDPNGNRLWCTYYGGSSSENGVGITTDVHSDVIITGTTGSTDFPVTIGAFQTSYGVSPVGSANSNNAFVVKLDNSGDRMWATYCGGSGADGGTGVTSDPDSNVVITGSTGSKDFPVTAGAFQTAPVNGSRAFVAKFDHLGNILWATYCGGTKLKGQVAGSRGAYAQDNGTGIALDGRSSIVITGTAFSVDFPVTAGAFQTNYTGSLPADTSNAFVTKFDGNGNLLWSSYYGGHGGEVGVGITTDADSNVIIAGITRSIDFPVTPGVFQTSFGGKGAGTLGGDAFVVKFNSAGKRLWASYDGGSNSETTYACSSGPENSIYIMGEWEDVSSGTFRTTSCSLQNSFSGTEDWFLSKFDSSGQMICSSFIGGPGELDLDAGASIATYGNFVYIAGGTSDSKFPATAGAFQTSSNAPVNSPNAVIMKFCGTACGDGRNNYAGSFISNPASGTTVCQNTLFKFNSFVSSALKCDTSTYSYQWTFSGGNPDTSTVRNPSINYTIVGAHPVQLIVSAGCGTYTYSSSITIDSVSAQTSSTPTTCGLVNGSATVVVGTGVGPYSYKWSNGTSGAATISSVPVGAYIVTVTDAFSCTQTASVTVGSASTLVVSIGRDTSICVGDSAQLSASGGGTGTYSWSPSVGLSNTGISNPRSSPPVGTTMYTVNVNNGGCVGRDSMSVTVVAPPVQTSTVLDAIYTGQTIVLNATGGVTYLWTYMDSLMPPGTYLTNRNTANPTFGPTAAGDYKYLVSVKNGIGCDVFDTFNIKVTELICNGDSVFMPNAFSPNNDGHNDILYFHPSLCLYSFNLLIFDRWGEVVFQTANPAMGWDGNFNSLKCNQGVYIYYLKGTMNDGTTINRKGSITLLR